MAKGRLSYMMYGCMTYMSYKQKKRLTLDLKTLILLVLCFIPKSGVKPKPWYFSEGWEIILVLYGKNCLVREDRNYETLLSCYSCLSGIIFNCC